MILIEELFSIKRQVPAACDYTTKQLMQVIKARALLSISHFRSHTKFMFDRKKETNNLRRYAITALCDKPQRFYLFNRNK